jgi:hypothetical protein
MFKIRGNMQVRHAEISWLAMQLVGLGVIPSLSSNKGFIIRQLYHKSGNCIRSHSICLPIPIIDA